MRKKVGFLDKYVIGSRKGSRVWSLNDFILIGIILLAFLSIIILHIFR